MGKPIGQSLVGATSSPLATHPEDQAPYGAGENGAQENAVARVVTGVPSGTPSSGAVPGFDDRLGQSHIAGDEQQEQGGSGEEVFGDSHSGGMQFEEKIQKKIYVSFQFA
jgi:hypothetical protein